VAISGVTRRAEEGALAVKQWQGFLRRFRWEWFGTLTYAPPSPRREHSSRLFGDFIEDLKQQGAPEISWFRVLESAAAQTHIHFLAGNTGSVTARRAEDYWGRKHGFARIRQFDPLRAGIFYMLKTAHHKDFDWDASTDLDPQKSTTLPSVSNAASRHPEIIDSALLTVDQIAARLAVRPSWVYANAASLGGFRLGKYWRFEWESVVRQLRRQNGNS
jgi:hypothetical protein